MCTEQDAELQNHTPDDFMVFSRYYFGRPLATPFNTSPAKSIYSFGAFWRNIFLLEGTAWYIYIYVYLEIYLSPVFRQLDMTSLLVRPILLSPKHWQFICDDINCMIDIHVFYFVFADSSTWLWHLQITLTYLSMILPRYLTFSLQEIELPSMECNLLIIPNLASRQKQLQMGFSFGELES